MPLEKEREPFFDWTLQECDKLSPIEAGEVKRGEIDKKNSNSNSNSNLGSEYLNLTSYETVAAAVEVTGEIESSERRYRKETLRARQLDSVE